MIHFENGEQVIAEIESQAHQIIQSGKSPEVIVIGNYYYYLLKDHYTREIDAKVNKFFPILDIEVLGHKLDILVKPKTIDVGFVIEESRTVTVYGR